MANTLTLTELQYLDALVKKISHYSNVKDDMKIVIREKDFFITGDFLLYNQNKTPQIKIAGCELIYPRDIPKISDEAITNLLLPLKDPYSGITRTTCKIVAQNPDYLYELIFRNNIIKTLMTNFPWSGLDPLQPYLYNPIFLDKQTSVELPFYALSHDIPYEVISIISSGE